MTENLCPSFLPSLPPFPPPSFHPSIPPSLHSSILPFLYPSIPPSLLSLASDLVLTGRWKESDPQVSSGPGNKWM